MSDTIAPPSLSIAQQEAWTAALSAAHKLCVHAEDINTSHTDIQRLSSDVQTCIYRLFFAHGLTIDNAGVPCFAEPDITPDATPKPVRVIKKRVVR